MKNSYKIEDSGNILKLGCVSLLMDIQREEKCTQGVWIDNERDINLTCCSVELYVRETT